MNIMGKAVRRSAPVWRVRLVVVFVIIVVWAIGTSSLDAGIWTRQRAVNELSGSSLVESRVTGSGWINVTKTDKPPAMAGAIMAYSTHNDVFVLFGGWNRTTFGDTWTFDPSSESWTVIQTRGAPPARGDGNFAYDETADAFVLFGGWYEMPTGTYHRFGDTWIFYLANRTWIQRFPSVSPSPRSDSAVTFDAARQRVLLFGGFDGSGYLGDMWAYNYTRNSWSQLAPQGIPSPRADGRMVYDRRDRQVYLFGGNDYSGRNFTFHHLGDTWRFDSTGESWTQVVTSVSPAPRDYSVLAYNPDTGNLLLVGGFGNLTILDDTWTFTTTRQTWNLFPGTNPPARFAAVGGYAPSTHVLVLFGGLGDRGLLADTWFFNEPSALGPTSEGTPGFLLSVLVFAVIGSAILLGLRLRRSRMSHRGGELHKMPVTDSHQSNGSEDATGKETEEYEEPRAGGRQNGA